MIKLTLPPKPVELTKEKQAELTSRFKANPKTEVWKQSWIVSPLLAMTNRKCAYSEMQLGEEGKYAQIEHIHPKSKYPDEVVEWGNLIPSCNVCNSKKSTIDTKKVPMVNPLVDNPKDYFYIKNGRLNVKDNHCTKAINTLTYCDLNNMDQLRRKRIEIEKYLEKRLKEIYDTFPLILQRKPLLSWQTRITSNSNNSLLPPTCGITDISKQRKNWNFVLYLYNIYIQVLLQIIALCSEDKTHR